MLKLSRRLQLKAAVLGVVLLLIGIFGVAHAQEIWEDGAPTAVPSTQTPAPTIQPTPIVTPTQIVEQFPGGDIRIEERLRDGVGYKRYITSYQSEGNKIYALMTVPMGDMPKQGWPVIVFNHGYIAPSKYVTTGSYVAYVDAFATHGYIIFKSDYRGHGKSEGSSGRSRAGYVVDVLNAVNLLKEHPFADPNRIGMWGHSMGGYVTVAAMLEDKDIKAGVIWAGTVRGFSDSNLLKNLSGPLQLHHATGDRTVPYRNSTDLTDAMREAGMEVELYIYQGDNHDIAANSTTALIRSLYFFDKYVKNAGEDLS